MSETVLNLLDGVALAAYVVAAVVLVLRRGSGPRRDVWWALLALCALAGLYEAAVLVEQAGLTDAFDPVEDLLRSLQVLAWGGLLYAFVQGRARRELERRETLLGTALDGGRLGVWEWNIERGHVEWYGLTESMFGVAPGDFDHRLETVRERVHPEDRDAMWADVERALAGDAPYLSRYRIALPGGEERWIEATGVVHRRGDGAPARMTGTVRDITEERRALRERERLAEIIESTTDFVGTASAEGRISYLNASGRRLTGLDADADVDGLSIADLHPEWATREIVERAIPAAMRDGVWSGESAVLTRDGREIPVSQVIVAHRTPEGRVEYLSTVIRDISERERAEAELRESEQRFRDFTGIATDWVWEMGPDLRFRDISERFEQLTGIPRSEVLGRSRVEIGDFDREDEDLARHLEDLEARRAFRDFRFQVPGRDGRVRWFETSGRPLFDEDGRFAGYRGTGREVTAEVEAIGALRESEERFRNLIEGSIQGIFIHADFEPLFVNRAFAEMLGYGDPGEILAMPSIEPLFAPGEIERMRGYSEARLAGSKETPAVYEYEAVCRDGSRRILQNVARRVTWQGRPAVQAAVVDVTERREAEQRLRGEKAFVDSAIDSLPGVFYVFDADGRYLRWNRNFETVTGHTSEELAELSPLTFVDDEERELVAARIERVLESGHATVEASLVAKDGTRYPYFFTGHRVEIDGRPCVVGMGIDIGELKATEAALRTSEARYRALYDDNPSTYATIDAHATIRSINRYGAGQLGYEVDALVGTDARDLYPEEERVAFERFLAECIARPESPQRWELPKRRADGSLLWMRETARAVRGPDGESVVLVVSEDVSEARDLSERLAFEATHDGLTGMINRREFESRLARVIETARASDSHHAICYLDLDQFKVVNDTCGHMAGDELLRQLGAVLEGIVRRRDTLARLGGDEFGVLIEHCPLPQAVRVARALRRAVEDYRFQWEDYSFKIGASIGVVPIDAASPGAAHVLGMADNACYVAKEQGRNRVHVYRADDAEIARRTGEMQWVARLDSALENDRFRLVRQRIVPVAASGEGEHYELLLRMEDEDGALISPGAFLPAAERYNVAVRIDRWVLDAALERLSGSPAHLASLYLCGINLSGQSLTDEAFLAYAIRRIRESSVPPEKLCFEITETAAIANFAGAHRFITSLRTLGCHFALDDFGSGLSSFGYLKTLPVDFLKIDGTFVKDIVDDPIDLAMVSAINEIGQVIGKRTIAEFVESEAILEHLRAMGVDYAQGYHIGRPEPLPTDGELSPPARRSA